MGVTIFGGTPFGWIAYAAMATGAAVVPRLPRPVQSAAADLAGAAAYVIGRPARWAAAENLSVVLGRDDPDLIALRIRQAFRTQSHNYVDLFRLPRLSMAAIEELVEVRGVERVRAALDRGRGAILVTAHLGNVDIVAQIARAHDLTITAPVEPIRPPALLRLVIGLRSVHGIRFVPVGPTALPEIRAALRSNQLVAIAIDRDVQHGGASHQFFGRPARISDAPVLLSLRTGAPLIPIHTQRLPSGRIRVVLSEPIVPPTRGRGGEAVRELLHLVLERIEGFIRQTPGQWVMFHRLFARTEAA